MDQLEQIWKKISYFSYLSFVPENNYELFKWRAIKGKNIITLASATQSWKHLKDISHSIQQNTNMDIFEKHPYLLLSFLILMPHRINENFILFLNKTYSLSPEDEENVTS